MLQRYICGCLIGLLVMWAGNALAEETTETIAMEHLFSAGYNGVSLDRNAGKAREYDELRSTAVGNFDFTGNVGHKHLFLEGEYRGENDYRATGHLDLDGGVVLNLSSERLWHNLDHIDYVNRPDGVTSAYNTDFSTDPTGTLTPDAAETRAIVSDVDPDADYGVRVQFDQAEAKIRLGDEPAHLRLKYWRQIKEGKQQLRFVEEGHDTNDGTKSCDSCHLQSKTRRVKRVTEELSASADAHIGYVDLAVEQLLRLFTVKDPIPVDTYYGHSYGAGDAATPDVFQHSEDPESRLLQSTVKARTSLSGGLVADAAYTYGKRENRSDLAPAAAGGIDGVYAKSVYQKAAGNLSYTPVTSLTLALRYRMLDIDTSNSDTITANYFRSASASYPAAATGPPLTFPVRENMDINRYQVETQVTWRPSTKVTLKGEAQREVIVRGNTDGAIRHSGSTAPIDREGSIDPVWELPDQETIDQLRVALTARPLRTRALRLNTWYRYQHSSDPAYGTSFADRHEGFAGLNYAARSWWGATAAARVLHDRNDKHGEIVWETDTSSGSTVRTALFIPSKRTRDQQSCDLGFWFTPLGNLTTGLNYGYLHSKIRQGVLFGASDIDTATSAFYNIDSESDYTIDSQTVALYATLQLLKSLSLQMNGYYLQSKAEFLPEAFSATYTNGLVATSDGLTEISKLDIRQHGVSAGLDWAPLEALRFGVTYSFDDYDARNSDLYDGSAQSLMGTVACRW